jgi:carbon-monoxide dehydrogenase small subunit
VRKELIELQVNGRRHQLAVAPNETLLDVLRETLRLTGTKCACDDSSCGSCTVVVDGQPMLSCVMLAASYQDSAIQTIESLATQGELDALQRGFVLEGGSQCGFCTPGVVMALHTLLEKSKDPSEDDVRAAISGNICRCTGYMQICRAVRYAVTHV